MHDTDTITAISSPSGEGGIGVVRLSGPRSHSILKKVFRPAKQAKAFVSHNLRLGFIFDPATSIDIDEVFAVVMKEPHTYTREEMAEIFCHGGIVSQKRILEVLIKNGARIAEPGEFTKQAYLNGRIDLAQAESVLDIIESQTSRELENALAHIKGALSEKLGSLRNDIISLLAEVEASIDFPDEELALDESGWHARLLFVEDDLSTTASSYYEGRAIKTGLDLLILGRTNVGKSSLLNALAADDKAIVTHYPGTTRDLIEDMIVVKGVKFRITDTAGLRQSLDPIEQVGIDKAKRRIPDADGILWVLDSSLPYSPEDEEVYREINEKRARTIAVFNKADLKSALTDDVIRARGIEAVQKVSALTGAGISDLKETLHGFLKNGKASAAGVTITNVRQRDLVERAGVAVSRAREGLKSGFPQEIIALELREAARCLGDIIGDTCREDVLEEIFSRFCIGK
jgi:tRNA modification GTPase